MEPSDPGLDELEDTHADPPAGRRGDSIRKLAGAISVPLLLLCVMAVVTAPAGAQMTETYLFRDSFEPIEGAGNVLVAVSNADGTIATDGDPGFLDGAFVTQTISEAACPSAPTVRAWAFPDFAGLRHANTTPAIATGSYSISMLLRYDPMDTDYARLIDFSNSTADDGIYKLDGGVSFYPEGEFADGSFVEGQDVFVTITRDAASQLVSLYIDGAPAGTYDDTGDLYVPSASALYFLMDNTTGSAAIDETDPGTIAYLQVSDTPKTPPEVVASLATICEAVSCGDGTIHPGEECDDGGVEPGDGCDEACQVEPVCETTPPEPCRTAAKASLSIVEKAAGKEKLRAKLQGFDAATSRANFGDPAGGTTRYDVCLYDGKSQVVAELNVSRAGASCGAKPCWKAKGTTGYGYKDPAAAADGVQKITAAGGAAGKGKLKVQAGNKAKRGQTALPTGLTATLAGATSARLQVRTSDAACFEAVLDNVVKSDATRFKAKAP